MSTFTKTSAKKDFGRKQSKIASTKPRQQSPQQKKGKQLAKKKINKNGKHYSTPRPSNTVIIPTQEALYQGQVIVTPQWNPLAIQEMMAAFSSYFLTRSIAASPDFQARMPEFFNGMFTLWTEFTKIAAGTPALEKRLRIVHDLANAFQPKEVVKHTYTKVSYAWSGIIAPANGTYTTGWNTWDFVIPDEDNSAYNAPALVYSPAASDTAYSAFMSQVQAISSARAHWLSTVLQSDPSPLNGDPSAFAKVYSYLGLNPSKSGGFYNDCENEVDILAPILAHNVQYPIAQQDDRVAEKLVTNEGGPAFNLAPMLQCYNNWFNKKRIDVKFLDFYEVVYQLIYWYLAAVAQAVAEGASPTQFQLPFSQQDFTIIVRNMLMTNFKDQWMVQFCGPLAYDNSGATNFLPLQILGNCYGNDQFKRLLGPSLLAENLSMLQTVGYKYNKQKSSINETVCVPCWGYYNDIPPLFNIPGNEVPTPLFTVPPDAQKQISLVDCTISGNTYINVNGAYYMNVLENWNNAITSLKKYINVCDMSNLSPPHNAAFLQVTRVYGYVPQKTQKLMATGAYKQLNFPSLRPISNLRSGISKTDLKKALPQLPQPTNVSNITIQDQLATYPLSKEIHEFLEYLIIPSVRYDPNSPNDVLNKTMYQTITYEGLSQVQNATSNAPAYLNRIADAANMSVEGSGKIASSSISTMLNHLTANGNGGILAGLLGGVAKSLIPGADGIIDAIATAMPF